MLRLSQIAGVHVSTIAIKVYAIQRTHIVWSLPPEATLEVVVAEHNVHEPVKNHVTFRRSQTVDGAGLLGEQLVSKIHHFIPMGKHIRMRR
jgi:hypothetical protein